jgi:hypothetical protein
MKKPPEEDTRRTGSVRMKIRHYYLILLIFLWGSGRIKFDGIFLANRIAPIK